MEHLVRPLAGALALLLIAPGALAQSVRFTPDDVLARTNGERSAAQVVPLAHDARLSAAAQLKAEDLAREGYYAHVSPAGVTPMHWADAAGYEYRTLGENLAVHSLEADAEDIVTAFMESPAHRANLLSDMFTDLGVGVATGTYSGKDAVYAVQLFGSEWPESVAPVSDTVTATGPDAGPGIGAVEDAPELARDVPRAAPGATGAAPSPVTREPADIGDPLLREVLALIAPLSPTYRIGMSSTIDPLALAVHGSTPSLIEVLRFDPEESGYASPLPAASLLRSAMARFWLLVQNLSAMRP